MYRLTVRDHVLCAHSIADPAFGPAQRLHGVTYVIEASVASVTRWSRRMSPTPLRVIRTRPGGSVTVCGETQRFVTRRCSCCAETMRSGKKYSVGKTRRKFTP